jgi:hypothetical protein
MEVTRPSVAAARRIGAVLRANVVAWVALFLALSSGAFAVAELNGGERRAVKKIANKEITKRLEGLSVQHAATADTATNANHATSADIATSADTATNANHATSADIANSADSATHAGTADTATTAGVASSLTPSEAFHVIGTAGEPGFGDACWVNLAGGFNTVAFYKDPTGVVHLRGVVMNSCPFTVALPLGIGPVFTLPVGYRPPAEELFLTERNDGPGRLDVQADGKLVATGGSLASGGWISLDGLSFRPGG